MEGIGKALWIIGFSAQPPRPVLMPSQSSLRQLYSQAQFAICEMGIRMAQSEGRKRFERFEGGTGLRGMRGSLLPPSFPNATPLRNLFTSHSSPSLCRKWGTRTGEPSWSCHHPFARHKPSTASSLTKLGLSPEHLLLSVLQPNPSGSSQTEQLPYQQTGHAEY